MPEPYDAYLTSLQSDIRSGIATEHTHRPTVKRLIEQLDPGVTAFNEPRRIECGAPDLVVARGSGPSLRTLGHIEAKDIGVSLDEAEGTDQLHRYLSSLENLVLTDYLEFRWFVDGERRLSARLGVMEDGRTIRAVRDYREIGDLLGSFLSHKVQRITNPQELAERMARLTHLVRDIVVQAFERGRASALLSELREAVSEVLIPGLPIPQFADMYAQTLSYGLFAARCNHRRGRFQRVGAAAEIPKNEPLS